MTKQLKLKEDEIIALRQELAAVRIEFEAGESKLVKSLRTEELLRAENELLKE